MNALVVVKNTTNILLTALDATTRVVGVLCIWTFELP